jgi:hypothetical protein
LGTPDWYNVPDDFFDQYLNAEVMLPKGDQMLTGTVKFPDGAEAELEYSANMMAENVYAQCDIDGNQWLLMDAIIDHQTTGEALQRDNAFIMVNN